MTVSAGLSISYNELTDIVTIEGKDWSGDFFRHFASYGEGENQDHRVFKVTENRGGVVCVAVITDPVISREFDREKDQHLSC
jgi:hypothetical protein